MIPLEYILQCVCEVCEVTPEEVKGRKKTTKTSIAKGLYYTLGIDNGHHPINVAKLIDRSRCVCLIMRKRYRGYIYIGDKYIKRLYAEISQKINQYSNYD